MKGRKMKFILFCLFALSPASAFAMDCTSPRAIAQAKAAFGQGFDPKGVSIENVGEGTLGAIPVCEGVVNVLGPLLGANKVRVWSNNSDGSITEYLEDSDENITTENW
jgi:hypothetical protein